MPAVERLRGSLVDVTGFRPPGSPIRLFIAPDRRGPALEQLLVRLLDDFCGGGSHWAIDRSSRGASLVRRDGSRSATAISLSHAAGRVVVAVTAGGRLGVDAETRGRVAAHATPADRWLSAAERAACAAAAAPHVELACRWVLKEALAKALGTGLPPDPSLWSFSVGERIEAGGTPAGFDYLLCAADDLLLGLAVGSGRPDHSGAA